MASYVEPNSLSEAIRCDSQSRKASRWVSTLSGYSLPSNITNQPNQFLRDHKSLFRLPEAQASHSHHSGRHDSSLRPHNIYNPH